MDNVTHALAGALLAGATVQHLARRVGPQSPAIRRAAVAIGVLTAELPDVDLFWSGPSLGMGKLAYLLHHRGHTHTVVFAVAAAVAVWGIALAIRRDLRGPVARPVLLLALAGTLSHVALDYTNSYGVHPWWPVDNRWVYGDAVFIVEPWLWIVALPPLFFASGAVARVAWALLLAVILGAAWRVDMVGNDVALVLTAGAVAWAVLVGMVRAERRIPMGFVAWLGIEVVFFASSVVGRRVIEREAGPSLVDAALSPAPGNPLCISAVVVSLDGETYRARMASVAPVPLLRGVDSCRGRGEGVARDTAPRDGGAGRVRWGAEWSAPIAELRALAAANCEVSAALRFIRVPAWRRLNGGDVELYDLRYGEGSFASIVAAAEPARCPAPLPPWQWPRHDVLGMAGATRRDG